jgi:arsenate reductase-like glutaredoxin family protein
VKHNLAKERPSRELLERLIEQHGLEGVLSTRSPAFKALGLDAKTLTEAEAVRLMLEEPNLMRRPLVLSKGKAIFGYAPQEYEKLK